MSGGITCTCAHLVQLCIQCLCGGTATDAWKLEQHGNSKLMNDDIHITCRTISRRYIQIVGSKNLIFQKLSDQEKIILSVLDYIEK